MGKRIVWLCNSRFSEEKIKTTGSWLLPMAEKLQSSGEVQLYNITIGNVSSCINNNYKGIEQWVLPRPKTSHYGMIPDSGFCGKLADLINQINPDLVHIWGTEGFWASIYEQGYIKHKSLIDIQGILSSYYSYYYGGLSFVDILKCIHAKEVILPWRTLFNKKRIFRKRGETESQCIKTFRFISYQSDWVRKQLMFINPDATYLPTRIMLRDSFYFSEPWKYKEDKSAPIIFTSASGAIPYKGLQIAFKAVQLLKKKYPHISLRVAGNMFIGNKILDGFSVYIKNLIRELDITDNVHLLGSIDESQIVKELQQADVAVVPSFVETYCLAFAEAMMVGVPTVVSYAGAMPELARHNKECLFYNSIDYQSCAAYVNELIQNKNLAIQLSTNARYRRLKENNPQLVVQTQLDIYNRILNGKQPLAVQK